MADQGARLREDAVAIYHAALARVAPGRLVGEHLLREGGALLLLDREARPLLRRPLAAPVYLVAAGKAALAMAAAAAEVVGAALAAGVAIVPAGREEALAGVRVCAGGHPLPDGAGARATARAVELLRRARARELVLVLVSGGASALLVEPAPGLGLEDKRAVTRLLLDAGVAIAELNAVRKHCSGVKGGLAALRAAPAAVWGLLLSDVPGDDAAAIGSGPTVADPSTYAGAWDVLARSGLLGAVPGAVRERLARGRAGELPETPKPGDPRLPSLVNVVLAGIREALAGAAEEARRRGYRVVLYEQGVAGDTEAAAVAFVDEVARRADGAAPLCVLAGGETTVRVAPGGKGGRNQHFALAAATGIAGSQALLLSAGTDGVDGPTGAAGAFADGSTLARARARGLDARAALARCDSHAFFSALGDLFRPGPTGTNVMDLKVALLPAGARLPHFRGLC